MLEFVAHPLGVGLALLAALGNAVSYLAIRLGTDEGRTTDAIVVVMLINLAIIAPLIGLVYWPDLRLTPRSVAGFVGSGIFGTLLGRAFAFLGVASIGASRATPIFAANGLIAALLGVLLLGETLGPLQTVGILLVVVGASTISWETTQENPQNLSRRELLLGLAFPIAAALSFGVDPVFARIGLVEGTPAPVGLGIKLLTATVGFAGYIIWREGLPDLGAIRPRERRWFLLAGVANTVFLLSFYSALGVAPVSVVAPVMISYTFWVVVISALFVPARLERVTWRLVAASVAVVVGLALLAAFG